MQERRGKFLKIKFKIIIFFKKKRKNSSNLNDLSIIYFSFQFLFIARLLLLFFIFFSVLLNSIIHERYAHTLNVEHFTNQISFSWFFSAIFSFIFSFRILDRVILLKDDLKRIIQLHLVDGYRLLLGKVRSFRILSMDDVFPNFFIVIALFFIQLNIFNFTLRI